MALGLKLKLLIINNIMKQIPIHMYMSICYG